MVRLNRLFKLVDEGCDGNSFVFFVENTNESTPFFAEGFHQAGQVAVAGLRAKGTWPDYEALPVVFLYRHAVELALKGIVWNGSASGCKKTATDVSGYTEVRCAQDGR